MPAQPTCHVVLTDPLVRYIGEGVIRGSHAIASHVLRAALRLPIQHDEPRARLVDAVGRTRNA